MNDVIPNFSFQTVFVEPWLADPSTYAWITTMGFFVTATCGLVGVFLLLRRMSLVGDAISHSVLPGLALAFIVSQSRGSGTMFIGAMLAAVLTTVIIEFIHTKTRIKRDSAISIAFTGLFAIGVVLISVFASKVDLDADCVLYGEIAFIPLEDYTQFAGYEIGPTPVIRMALVALFTAVLIAAFFKELLVSSFDRALAASLGIHPRVVHYALMCWLAVVVVSAFESVGAILVVAMLIVPGASAFMLSRSLPKIFMLVVVHSALSAFFGLHLAIWLDSSIAAAMVLVATLLFILSWLCSPRESPFARGWRVNPNAVMEQT